MDEMRGVFISVSGLEASRVDKCTEFLDRKNSSRNVTHRVVKDVSQNTRSNQHAIYVY